MSEAFDETISLAHTADCAAQHFAPWMIEEQWFRAAVDAVRNGTLKPRQVKAMEDDDEDGPPKRPAYTVHDGTAVIPIVGAMAKAAGKYAQTGTVDTRRAIRKAVHDDNVESILLHIDSPGGTVAGTADLAADVAAANALKPVYAHVDDLGASAAYWVASQTRRITANATGRVGSIGTVLVLDDTSGKYAAQGIKVHVISTGKFKGAGTDGVPITPEQLAMFQEGVDDLNEHFVKGVAKGRNLPIGKVREVADGRVHIAEKAKGMGLIDDVCSLDAAVAYIAKDRKRMAEAATAADVAYAGYAAARDNVRNFTALAEVVAAAATPEPVIMSTDATAEAAVARDTEATPGQPIVGEPPQGHNQKENDMANETQSPPASTNAAGTAGAPQGSAAQQQAFKLTDDAMRHLIEQGKIAGRAEGRAAALAEFREIVGACAGRPQTAVNAYLAGQNAATVKLIVDAEVNAEIAANAKLQALEVENARLSADRARMIELSNVGGHPGVPMGSVSVFAPGASAQASSTNVTGLEPEAQAKLEWDSDPMLRARNNNNEKGWMLFRTQQLKGNVRVLKTA
jgi:signal peptide peptidase SppA